MAKFVRWVSFQFVQMGFEFFISIDLNITCFAHFFKSLHSLQNLFFVGMIIPLSNAFFQDLGKIADIISPSSILK